MTFRRHVRRPVLFALALTLLTLLALQLPVFGSPHASMEWVYTAEAQARTALGDCYDPGATVQEVCVELCFVTQEGHILPQNEFSCRLLF